MEIRFCSVCNESVPDSDFDAGRALIDGSESLHVACALRRGMEGRRFRRWLVGGLALYAAVVSSFLLARSLRPAEPPPAAVDEVTRAHVAEAVEASRAALAGQVDARARQVHEEVLAGVTAQAETLGRRIEDNTKGLTMLDNTLHDLAERARAAANEDRALDARLDALEQWRVAIQQLAERLEAALNQAPAEPTTPPPPGPGGAPEPGPGPGTGPETGPAPPDPQAVAQRAADVQKWIERLRDSDDNVVFTATIELARLKALEATAALVGVLEKHKDFYARLGAATALGEIPALDGVPALIEALGDSHELVRTAADEALRRVTGEDFNFASTLPRNDRARIQRRWREYWKANEATLRERLGQ